MTESKKTKQAGITRRSVIKGLSTAAGAGAVALAAPGIVRRVSAAGPIRIGVISPLSGDWTIVGKAHFTGFKMATDEINAKGGVLGRKFELIAGDYKSDSRLVVEQANRLIRQEKVDFVAGTMSSADRNAAAPVVTKTDKILLYPTFYEGQEKEYFPGVCNKNLFMFGPVPSQQVFPHLDYMIKTHGKKFFMLGSDYAWPRVTNQVTKPKLAAAGGEVVGEVYTPFNTPQYESVLRQIRASGANVIFYSLVGPDSITFRNLLQASGAHKDHVIWTVGDEEFLTTALGPDVSAGDYASFDYFMSIKHPNNKKFLDTYRAEAGPDAVLNTVAAGMYNAAHMVAMAIEKSGEVSTDALREGLKGLTFDGAPQGSVHMRADDHQLVLPSYLMRVRKGWTSAEDMFEQAHVVERAEPSPANCDLPL